MDVLRTALARVTDPVAGAGSYEVEQAIAAAALIAAQAPDGSPVETGYGPKQPLPDLPADLRPLAARALDHVLGEANEHVSRWFDVDEGERWLGKVERLRTVLDPDTPPTVSYTPPPIVPEHTQIGTRIVQQELGVDRFRSLAGAGTDTPLGLLVEQLRGTTRRLDEVQAQLVVLAKLTQRDLQRIADGLDTNRSDTHGVVGGSAISIDLLIARRAGLNERLTGLIDTYQVLAASQPLPTQTAPAVARRPQQPVKLTGAQEIALRDIANGGVRMVEGGLRGTRRIAAPTGLRITTATVDSLIDKRLVERDQSTSLFHGQELRLTTAGRERYAAPPASLRTRAARTRPATTAGSRPPSSSAVEPALSTAATPAAGRGR